jgi:hypothetical protein
VVFEPDIEALNDDDRVAINTALLSGQGAEMAFSRGVLLVEGEGDKLFFETLRRRVAGADASGRLDELAIVWTGSNTRFGPWIRLLESYETDGSLPIEWLAVADSVDSSTELRRALEAAEISIPMRVASAMRQVSQRFSAGDEEGAIRATRDFNDRSRIEGVGVTLLPIDLEYSALRMASDKTVRTITKRLKLPAGDKDDLLRRLGSKYGAGPVQDALKGPWVRAVIADELPLTELSVAIREVLRRWFRFALGDARSVNEVLRAGGIPAGRKL